MPLWNVDVEKFFKNRYWTNRYIVQAASLAAAAQVANDIVDVERNVHKSFIEFTKVRTSDQVVGGDVFTIAVIGLPGLHVWTEGQALPLFNVVRVDFAVSQGRPSRKYLRTGLLEQDVVGDTLEPAYHTFINLNYAIPMMSMVEYVDVDGQAFVGSSVTSSVAMRQLKRGSKRALTPVIP